MSSNSEEGKKSVITTSSHDVHQKLKDGGHHPHGTEAHRSLDLRSFILKNFNYVVVTIVIVVCLCFGFGAFKYYKGEQDQKNSEIAFQFKKDVLGLYKSNKLSDDEFFLKLEDFKKKLGGSASPRYFLVALETSEYLMEKEKYNKALPLVEELYKSHESIKYLRPILGQTLVVLYEENGKINEAISLLEELAKGKIKVLTAKVYFDLGRLYERQGNKEKAKLNYKYITDNFDQDPLSKMAKIFLKGL